MKQKNGVKINNLFKLGNLKTAKAGKSISHVFKSKVAILPNNFKKKETV